jgi:hypothetical protein
MNWQAPRALIFSRPPSRQRLACGGEGLAGGGVGGAALAGVDFGAGLRHACHLRARPSGSLAGEGAAGAGHCVGGGGLAARGLGNGGVLLEGAACKGSAAGWGPA